jgi:hypothetical protein
MEIPLTEILTSLKSPACPVCRYHFGPASCFDDDEYEKLGAMYDEAVSTLTAALGSQFDPIPSFPGECVERAACWQRGNEVVYAILTFADNTRYRSLILGVARRGTVVTGCWGSDT